MSNELKLIEKYLERSKEQVAKALPTGIKPERFLRIALTTLRRNPRLQKCEPVSFLGAMMTSAQLGLEVNSPLGEAYIIPYGTEATFQMGYKGVLSLAYRTGQYKLIYAMEAYSSDKFQFGYGLDPFLIHNPAVDPQGEPIYYYAVYHLVGDGKSFRVWSKEKVERHAKKYSKSYKQGKKDSPWFTDFDSMAKKTVLLDLLRYGPKSAEFSQALSVDGGVRREISEDIVQEQPEVEIPVNIDIEEGDGLEAKAKKSPKEKTQNGGGPNDDCPF